MTYNFTVQQQPIYGAFGEFSVGVGSNKITAKYLLTKIKPGNSGTWENHLASQMKPWREIFQINELSFEELIQRDLDDSRVAHDLIPYLLGESGHHARFFPPILAVLVPKKNQGSGISKYYPKEIQTGSHFEYGDLFTFDKVKINDQESPLGQLKYNAQKTAMVIVDGQHRAMAVLAIHRQINQSWQADPFAQYYDHIEVSENAISHIELPVCVIYFPDINEENKYLKENGIDLISVSREIFTVVNKNAKPVGKSRELLLNDEDFAAFMMRRTLTKLRNHNHSTSDHASIFSFAYGDEENGASNQAMTGKLEYSSAVALHKMHAATCFAMPGGFSLRNTQDVTTVIHTRNSSRPIKLLTGIDEFRGITNLSRHKAKTYTTLVSQKIVSLLGDITDTIMIPLFNNLRPFAIHNSTMQKLLTELSDPNSQADPIQSKCRSLIFEGSGVRSVFEEHQDRLNKRKDNLNENNLEIPSHLNRQMRYCDSVIRAIEKHEDSIKLNRTYELFGIDPINFNNREDSIVDAETKKLRHLSRTIYDTVSTQAFQIGYLMAVLTAVEKMCNEETTYETRLKNTQFVSELYIEGLNSIFTIGNIRHRTFTGYASEPRANIFNAHENGFRGLLLAGNVRELNEKQWEFFRYVILEIVHSEKAYAHLHSVLENQNWHDQIIKYKQILPRLVNETFELRQKYINSAVNAALSSEEFKRNIYELQIQGKADQKSEEEIAITCSNKENEKKNEIEKLCLQHIQASLSKIENQDSIISRFS